MFRTIADSLYPLGVGGLVDALAWDGGLPGYNGNGEADALSRICRAVRALPTRERRLLLLDLQDDLEPSSW